MRIAVDIRKPCVYNYTHGKANTMINKNNIERNSKKLIKRLESEGWILVRVKGDHHHFKHPDRKGLVTVAHPNRDIPTGTVRSIYKQAGWL